MKKKIAIGLTIVLIIIGLGLTQHNSCWNNPSQTICKD